MGHGPKPTRQSQLASAAHVFTLPALRSDDHRHGHEQELLVFREEEIFLLPSKGTREKFVKQIRLPFARKVLFEPPVPSD